MSSADPDKALIRACTELKVVFARFVIVCEVVDDAEFNAEPASNLETVRSQAQEAHYQWRSILKQINHLPFNTRPGASAKARILTLLIDYGFYSDEDVMVLIAGLTIDFDKLLEDDADCACQNHSTPLPAKRRKRIERQTI